MADVVYQADGSRTIVLYLPFSAAGREIKALHLKPTTLDHRMRWRRGEYASSLAILAELSGETEAVLLGIRDPDVDRVLDVMMAMLPTEMRDNIERGAIPLPESPSASRPTTPPGPGDLIPVARDGSDSDALVERETFSGITDE